MSTSQPLRISHLNVDTKAKGLPDTLPLPSSPLRPAPLTWPATPCTAPPAPPSLNDPPWPRLSPTACPDPDWDPDLDLDLDVDPAVSDAWDMDPERDPDLDLDVEEVAPSVEPTLLDPD